MYVVVLLDNRRNILSGLNGEFPTDSNTWQGMIDSLGKNARDILNEGYDEYVIISKDMWDSYKSVLDIRKDIISGRYNFYEI